MAGILTKGGMSPEGIRKLIKLMEAAGIMVLELKEGSLGVKIKRGEPVPGGLPRLEGRGSPGAARQVPPLVPDQAKAASSRLIITSPMAGTFHRTPSPDSDPFVEVGGIVKPGQTVCIIEAMKLMNEIHAQVKGRIAEILVAPHQEVVSGQPLFLLQPV